MMLHQLLLSLMALSVLFAPLSAPINKSYSAGRFDVTAKVEPGGALLVTENLTLRFVGGPFTYVFRELPVEKTDGIEVISAAIDGTTLNEGEANNQVEIHRGDPVKVTWHFAPTSDSTHTFSLTYRMHGVVRQEDQADVLIYQPLPDEHEYTIDKSIIQLTYPQEATLLGVPEVTAGQASVETTSGAVSFSANNVGEDASLIVALRFTPGSIISVPPTWQIQASEIRQRAPLFIWLAIGILAIGTFAILFNRGRFRREPVVSYETPTRPPDDFPPALTGLLINEGGVQMYGWAYALGTCFDLAQRGIVSVEEIETKSRWQKHRFELKLHTVPDDLRPHERGLIEAYFGTKEGISDSMPLQKIANSLTRRLKAFTEPLTQEAETLGFYSQPHRHARNVFLTIGLVLMIISVPLALIMAFTLMTSFGPWPLLLAAALFIVGIVAAITAATIPILTDERRQQAWAWKQFHKYLKRIINRREDLPYAGGFSEYLPYAAAFGIAEAWVTYLKRHEGVNLPRWFHALSQGAQSGNTAAFVAMMAAVNSSVGGTSSAAVSAGASGAAGGGASGAG